MSGIDCMTRIEAINSLGVESQIPVEAGPAENQRLSEVHIGAGNDVLASWHTHTPVSKRVLVRKAGESNSYPGRISRL